MIRSGNIIKHSRMRDVALQVTEVLKDTNELVLTGRWVNLGQTGTYAMSVVCAGVRIQRSEIAEWSKCDEPNAECIRNARWVSCL